MRQRKCEFVRQWRRDAGHAIWELTEIARGEGAILQEIEQKGVHVRAHRLHGIERERIPIALICAEYAHRGIAAMCEQCEARLRL